MNRYVKFTGDYSKLKSMGFTFQKLYAGNYMQWEKGGFRVWKKGSDITFGEIDLYTLLKHMEIETNPVIRHGKYLVLYSQFNENYERTILPTAEGKILYDTQMKSAIEAHKKDEQYYETIPKTEIVSSTYFHLPQLDTLNELIELGWVEIVD